MAKRGRRGQGSVYQRTSDKLWVAQRTVNKHRSRQYARTKDEARAKLRAMLNPLPAPIFDGSQTIAAFLESWYVGEIEDTIGYATQTSYRQAITAITRHIGTVTLCELNPQHLSTMYRAMRDEVSAGTIRRNHILLKRALRKAVQWGHIASSPHEGRKAPRYPRHEIEVYSERDLRTLIDAAEGTTWAALWVVLGMLGLRISEALALRWSDVDWAAGKLSVVRQLQYRTGEDYASVELKTERSRRTLTLAPSEIAFLRAHRPIALEARRKPHVDRGLIFPRPDGRPMNRQVVSDNLDRQADELGLRRIRVHDLRHTAATSLIKHGVPIKVVSEMLGHSDILMTLRTYAHVTEGMQGEAAARRESIWQSTANGDTMVHEDEARDELPSVG